MYFLLRLIYPGDIIKGYRGCLGGEKSSPAAPEVHRLGIRPLCPAEDEEEQAAKYHEGQEIQRQTTPVYS